VAMSEREAKNDKSYMRKLIKQGIQNEEDELLRFAQRFGAIQNPIFRNSIPTRQSHPKIRKSNISVKEALQIRRDSKLHTMSRNKLATDVPLD